MASGGRGSAHGPRRLRDARPGSATHRARDATRPRPGGEGRSCGRALHLHHPGAVRQGGACATGCRFTLSVLAAYKPRSFLGRLWAVWAVAGPSTDPQCRPTLTGTDVRNTSSPAMTITMTRRATDESACTPDSVSGDLAIAGGGHPSRLAVAGKLLRPTRRLGRAALNRLRRPPPRGGDLAWPCSGWGLPSHPGRPGCW